MLGESAASLFRDRRRFQTFFPPFRLVSRAGKAGRIAEKGERGEGKGGEQREGAAD